MRQIWPAAVLLVSVFMAEGLQAQSIPSPIRYIEKKYSVGVFAGRLQTDTGELDAGPTTAPLLGARFDLQLTGPLSFMASLAAGTSDRTVFVRPEATDPDLDEIGVVDVGILIAEAGFTFHLTGPRTWHHLAPYIGAYAGIVDDYKPVSALEVEADLTDEQRFDFGPGFAAAGALGLDFYLTERLSIRAEGRDQLWRYTYPAGLSGTGAEESEWAHNPGFSVGAAFHF